MFFSWDDEGGGGFRRSASISVSGLRSSMLKGIVWTPFGVE